MSYLRGSWPHRFVDGDSEDYVYCYQKEDGKLAIEDYGGISDEGLIEMLFRRWETDDAVFKEHLLKRLAKRLNVKLRDKPLTSEETINLMDEKVKAFSKELDTNPELKDLKEAVGGLKKIE